MIALDLRVVCGVYLFVCCCTVPVLATFACFQTEADRSVVWFNGRFSHEVVPAKIDDSLSLKA